MAPGRRESEATYRALRDKYVSMLWLRAHDDELDDASRREKMSSLATSHPGALRELDEMPIAHIERRIAVLDGVLEYGVEPPEWARLLVSYHGWMRAALRIKVLVRGCSLEEAIERIVNAYEPLPDEPPSARFDSATVAVLLKPPSGRLNPWVFARVAEDHGRDPAYVRRMLFPGRSRNPT